MVTQPTAVDILVVGGGPAGLAAAAAAARAGASVRLVDARRRTGLPVRCAEYVPRLIAREVDVPDEAVAQRVDEMIVTVEDRHGACATLGRVRAPGFILHRERLERALAAEAAAAGATVEQATRAAPGPGGTAVLTGGGVATAVRARVVISAEGPSPAFGAAGRVRAIPAVQFTMTLAAPLPSTRVHFAPALRHGYAWLFPKGRLANVGLGGAPEGGRTRLLPLLEGFVARMRDEGLLTGDPPVGRTAGWIPVGGPPPRAVAGNVLSAGDAGGFTDPVTGAGIWPAIATGRFAGACAADAVRADDLSRLGTYDELWRGLFGGTLDRALGARRTMEEQWDAADFPGLVRAVWPGLRRAVAGQDAS